MNLPPIFWGGKKEFPAKGSGVADMRAIAASLGATTGPISYARMISE